MYNAVLFFLNFPVVLLVVLLNYILPPFDEGKLAFYFHPPRKDRPVTMYKVSLNFPTLPVLNVSCFFPNQYPGTSSCLEKKVDIRAKWKNRAKI